MKQSLAHRSRHWRRNTRQQQRLYQQSVRKDYECCELATVVSRWTIQILACHWWGMKCHPLTSGLPQVLLRQLEVISACILLLIVGSPWRQQAGWSPSMKRNCKTQNEQLHLKFQRRWAFENQKKWKPKSGRKPCFLSSSKISNAEVSVSSTGESNKTRSTAHSVNAHFPSTPRIT